MNFFSNIGGNRSKSVGSPPSNDNKKTTAPATNSTQNIKTTTSGPPSKSQGSFSGPTITKVSSTAEGDSERISISRSDGINHDILNVFSKPGVSDVITTSTKEEPAQPVEHDHGNIAIPRSDGLTHDIIQVFKAVSDAQGETLRMKSRAPSIGKIDLSMFSSSNNTPSTANPNAINVDRQISTVYYPKHVRIVHFSDTHNFLIKNPKNTFLPHGNILVHTGNFTDGGTDMEFMQFNEWLGSVTDFYHFRVVILGHRDVKLYGNNWDIMKKLLSNATHVLCHDEVTILGIRFYGCPWHWAHKVNYTIRPGAPANSTGRFDDIPAGIHVLLTHGPAYDRLDTTYSGNGGTEHWGSRELTESVKRAKPSLHLHGHVKDSRGIYPAFGNLPMTVNSAMVDKDCTVLYTTPHVIKATQAYFDKSKNLASWAFSIDTLDG